MSRPKYKEMYLEQKKRADYWAERHTELNKTLAATHAEGLKASQGRAAIRYDYSTLHGRAETFLSHIQHDIISPANWKNGWLYLAALDPENAHAFISKFEKFRTFIEEKKPKSL